MKSARTNHSQIMEKVDALKALEAKKKELEDEIAKQRRDLRAIPKIDNKTLKRRYEKIKPVLLDDNGHLRYIIGYVKERSDGSEGNKKFNINNIYELRNVCFTWEPVSGEVAEGLVKLINIETMHPITSKALFFQPTIAEVLAQIPEEYLDRTVAFETARNIHDIKTTIAINSYDVKPKEDIYIAKTTLYARKKPVIILEK